MKRSDPGGFWLLLIGLLVLAPSIWLESSLTGGDEHRVSFRTALETQQADQWLVPTYESEPRLRKPPLFYWVLTATSKIFGPSLFHLRFWGVLCGALLAVFTARWGFRQFSADPVLTFVIVISCLGMATESRRAMLDIPMTLFLLLSLERWSQSLKKGHGRDAIVAGVYLAIAALIKPPALYFAATGMLTMAVLQTRESGVSLAMKRIAGFVLFLISFSILFLPWWAYVQSAYPELLQERLAEQVNRREFSLFHPESVPSLLGGWLGLAAPWSLALIFAVFKFLRRPQEGSPYPERWLVVWLLISTIPFLFMKTFERYLIPLLPAFAILISTYLDSLDRRILKQHLLVAATITAIPALFVGAFVGWFAMPMLTVLTVLILLILWRFSAQGDAVNSALSTALCWSFCLGILLPTIGIGEGPPLSAEIRSSPIYQVGERHLPMLDVHVGRPIPDLSNDQKSLSQLPEETCYLIIAEADLAGLKQHLTQLSREYEILQRFGVFRSRKIFTRFSRSDATEEDWQNAFASRSLEGLKKPCMVIEVKPL